MDGAYSELNLSVAATTRRGQTVCVMGFLPSLNGNSKSHTRELPVATESLPASKHDVVPLVTTPEEWPIWRSAKPLILLQNLTHMYWYGILDGDSLIDNEPATYRTLVLRRRVEHKRDVFGIINFGDTAAQEHVSPIMHRISPMAALSGNVKSDTRMYIACFHLPVRLFRDSTTGKWIATWGESLIARTDGSVANDIATHWIGTLFAATDENTFNAHEYEPLRSVLKPLNCTPVFFPDSTRDQAYFGYCKQVLWPSFHNVDILDLTCACWKPSGGDPAFVWDQAATEYWWDAYVTLNQHFSDVLSRIVADNDIVWVHDYHLMMLPNLLTRSRGADKPFARSCRARIIFFLHIPFPTSQIFRSLTRGPELLHGIVGADVVGFHAFDHARHFLNACKRLMGLSHQSVRGGLTGVEYLGRTVTVVVRHVSVEPSEIAGILKSLSSIGSAHCLTPGPLSEIVSSRAVFAGVDSCQRLSGVALKLLSFERFLWEFEQWRGRVTLVQVAIREGKRVDDERRTSMEIRKIVERINAAFPGAVCLSEHSPSAVTLRNRVSLWSRATTLVDTAIREGLNLAPFEFIYTRQQPLSPGLVLASEFSATASLLNGAVRLNPFDLASSSAAFDSAMSMPQDERTGRHARDLPFVLSRPSGQWTREILHDMWQVCRHDIAPLRDIRTTRKFTHAEQSMAVAASNVLPGTPLNSFTLSWLSENANGLVIILELGETLAERGKRVGKYLKPNLNRPLLSNDSVFTRGTIKLINTLSEIRLSRVYVVVGAAMTASLLALSRLPHLGIAAANCLCLARAVEQTSYFGEQVVVLRRRLCEVSDHALDWKLIGKLALPILKWFTARTNGSAILNREPGLAWSYYRTDPEWGRIQANQLRSTLSSLLSPFNVIVWHADGMIEITPQRIQKSAVENILARSKEVLSELPGAIFCMGSDSSALTNFVPVHAFFADHNPGGVFSRSISCTLGGAPPIICFCCTGDPNVRSVQT